MLHITFSNRLEPLVERLLTRLAHAPASPFTTENIIIPSAASETLCFKAARGSGLERHARARRQEGDTAKTRAQTPESIPRRMREDGG